MLSKYGILYNQYLQEYEPIKYQDLVMDGTINEYLEMKDKEFNTEFEKILENLRNKYPAPNSDNFLENAKYNNFIYNMAEELVLV